MVRVIASHDRALDISRDLHAQGMAQISFERSFHRVGRRKADDQRELLGGLVEVVQVVVLVVEEVAHLLVRKLGAGAGRFIQSDRLFGEFQPLVDLSIGPVGRHEPPRQVGRVGDHLLQLAQGRRGTAVQGIGGGFPQVRQQPLVVVSV